VEADSQPSALLWNGTFANRK